MNKIEGGLKERKNQVVKASFRDCPIPDRKRFSQSSCLMPISVGQKDHEGDKFKAVIKLINSAFKSCTILVDDSIQHHTMQIGNTAAKEYWYQAAVKEGDLWLKRNENIYSQLTIPYMIMRWDDWVNHPDFKTTYQQVKSSYTENQEYQQALNANIKDFLQRYLKNNQLTPMEYDKAFSLCLDYLLEECAVMCLWPSKHYDFEVYPSGRNQAMTATYDYLIAPKYSNYIKSVAIRFKKYPINNQ